jgi:hypothetical protein
MELKINVKSIEAECVQSLAQIGIEMKGGIGTIRLSEDFLGWIGLNAGQHQDFIRVNPFVGVHCPAIMKLTAAAGGKRYRPKEIATFAVFLGTLCPDVEQFIFTNATDVKAEAQRLASIVAEFGLPYMGRIADYSALLPLLEARIPTLGGYPQRYAAALHLSGNDKSAVEFIDAEISSLKIDNETDVISALENLKQTIANFPSGT